MKLLLAIIIIAIISLVGAKISFFNRRLPMGLRSILLTGTEYIFVGIFLGSMGLELLDAETQLKLEPFLLFGLCWVGFLFGLQFEIRLLKKLPLYFFSMTAVQAILTFIIVTVPVFFLFWYFTELPTGLVLMIAITLGSTASSTSQSSLAIISRNYKIENRNLMELMRYIAGVDGVFALLFFMIALSILPWGGSAAFSFLGSLKWFVVMGLVGVVPAIVLILLNRTFFTQQEFFVFLIGVIMFCAGLAHTTQNSPLIAGFVCGIVIANFCKHRLRALAVVIHAEKTIYIALLILLGASWHSVSVHALIFAAVYIGLKILGKFLGNLTAVNIYKPIFVVPKKTGLALASEGGLAVAIVINFKLLFPLAVDTLITIVLIAIVLSEMFCPRMIMNCVAKGVRVAFLEKDTVF